MEREVPRRAARLHSAIRRTTPHGYRSAIGVWASGRELGCSFWADLCCAGHAVPLWNFLSVSQYGTLLNYVYIARARRKRTLLRIVNGKKENILAIRIDDEMQKTLERLAAAEHRSVSAMARLLIIEALQTRGIGP